MPGVNQPTFSKSAGRQQLTQAQTRPVASPLPDFMSAWHMRKVALVGTGNAFEVYWVVLKVMNTHVKISQLTVFLNVFAWFKETLLERDG